MKGLTAFLLKHFIMPQPKQIKFYKKRKNSKGNWIEEAYYDNSENYPTEESRQAFMSKYGFYKYQLV